MIDGPSSTLRLAERIHRARRVGVTFGRVYLGAKTNQLIARHLAPPDMKRRWSRFHHESARSIYASAVELRGLILKGCQFLGSRADVLPPAYVRVLSKLQDRVPPRTFAVIRASVERELGQPLDAVFEFFSRKPIASASLAQVHEARLHGGERVAVKVQYPEIAALVKSDLRNLRALFRAVGAIERDFDLMPLVDELGAHIPKELDFVNEGHNAEYVAKLFEGRDDLYVPRIHWEHTTRRVLVMEFIEGIKISDAKALRAAGVDPNQVMRTLIEAYCEQILIHGFFHADPHPGNLLVQPRTGSARLVFIDFGLTKELPAGFRKGVVEFAGALLGGRPEAMAQALVELGFETRENSPASLRAIADAILELASQLRRQAFIDRESVRSAGVDLPRLVRENPIVRIPSHLVFLGRVIALLSGLGHSLEAKVDMLSTILPYAVGSPEGTGSPSRSRPR